jgi:excisionase family DNA binding protein
LPNLKVTPTIFSIQEAAELLKISAKTLRRWEEKGILVPQRSEGGHRRYTKTQLEKFLKAKKVQFSPVTEAIAQSADFNLPVEATLPQLPPLLSSPFAQSAVPKPPAPLDLNLFTRPDVVPSSAVPTFPQIYRTLHQEQKQALRFLGKASVMALVLIFFLKMLPLGVGAFQVFAERISETQLAQRFVPGLATAFVGNKKIALAQPSTQGKILGDSRLLEGVRFQVNVPSNFAVNADFLDGVDITGALTVTGNETLSGNLAVNGGTLSSTAGTFNLLNTGTGTLNIGGGATVVNIGAASGTTAVKNNLQAADITQIKGVAYSFPSTQGSGGSYLQNDGTGKLTWTSIAQVSAITSLSQLSGVLSIANGGTNGTATPTAGAIAYGTGSAYAFSDAGTTGQCLVSGGTGAPTWATCSSGSGSTSGSEWQRVSGLVSPLISTDDLGVGGCFRWYRECHICGNNYRNGAERNDWY